MKPSARAGVRGATFEGAVSGVVQPLFRAYYHQGEALAVGASSHWSEFARQFDVEVDKSGRIIRLIGYGMGATNPSSIKQRLLTEAFVLAQVVKLKLPGLRNAVAAARRTVAAMGLSLSQDSFRQVATATLVAGYLRASAPAAGSPRVILVIGDGPGTLSALLHQLFPEAKIWLVDLGPVLLFQAAYLGRAFPDAGHSLVAEDGASDATFIYCPAELRDRLPLGEIDFAANVASMQEMAPETVADYFSFLRQRRTRLFYCCNRLEKRLPAGEVSSFLKYPWRAADVHLVDEACPWHQWFLGTAVSPNVRLAGIPLPLVHEYDGVHWHRLSRLDGHP